ncbi:STAS domain-containing protein [Blastococcus saxobsidens]|uniref:STAS domain-containing protein n=1 Tax=Blastococcus saxobsidens TaxID=138336 RepID=A0A6L9W866_9ACTN|nr:STAS domain-containing protein [Blastococcus saxobsidens]
MLFDVERTTIAGRAALTVRGEVDIATSAQVADAAASLLDTAPAGLVIDLSPTRFLDSSGARVLVAIARRCAAGGIELHVIAPPTNRPVRLPLELLQLDRVVPLIGSAGELPSVSAGRETP